MKLKHTNQEVSFEHIKEITSGNSHQWWRESTVTKYAHQDPDLVIIKVQFDKMSHWVVYRESLDKLLKLEHFRCNTPDASYTKYMDAYVNVVKSLLD